MGRSDERSGGGRFVLHVTQFKYGAVRLPVLAVVVVATIGLHSLAPHKELRFIFFATACLPILIGVGLGCALQRVPNLRRTVWGLPITVGAALLAALCIAVATSVGATRLDDWHRDRAVLQATAAARVFPRGLRPGHSHHLGLPKRRIQLLASRIADLFRNLGTGAGA